MFLYVFVYDLNKELNLYLSIFEKMTYPCLMKVLISVSQPEIRLRSNLIPAYDRITLKLLNAGARPTAPASASCMRSYGTVL